MFIGFGTLTNVATVIVGSGLGLLIGHRLSERVRSTVTSALGLVTLLIAAQSAMAVSDPELIDAVGDERPGAHRARRAGDRRDPRLVVPAGGPPRGRRRLAADARPDARRPTCRTRGRGATFVEGFVISSLVFCVGPLTILGSINEGLGNGADQLLLKAVLDGFASLAFAASFGIGVMASALSIAVIQGSLTRWAPLLGSFLPDAHLLALTATGGLILIGVAFRLLNLKAIPVADLLPALVIAPFLCQIAIAVH